MGEYGDFRRIPWYHVFVEEKEFDKVICDNEEGFGKVDFNEFVNKTVGAGW